MEKFNLGDIERLLKKFVDGQTTEREERELADFFSTADELPADWQAYKELFGSFKTDAYDFSDEEIHAMLSVTPTRRKIVIRTLRWAAAACVVAALAIVGVNSVEKAHTPSAEPSLTLQADGDAQPAKVVAQGNSAAELAHITVSSGGDDLEAIAPTPLAHNNKPKPPRMATGDRQNGLSDELMASEQDVTTTEMLETVRMLAMTDADVITITASPRGCGFLIDAVCADDNRQISSYELTRCADGTSLELKSIN